MIGDDESEQTGEQTEALKKKAATLGDVKDAFLDAAGASGNMIDSVEGLLSTFGGLDLSLSGIISKMLQLNQSAADLSKATGGMEGLAAQTSAVAKESAGLGLTIDQLRQTVSLANQQIFEFTDLSKEQQGAIGGTINKLEKLGVSSDVTAQTINSMNKSLGLTATEAAAASMDMAGFARELGSGMTPGKVAEQFNAALPKLSAYGKGATREFKKLAVQAKHTGMEVNELLGIAGQFDTFEDAANNTAQLNALLGTQLNSVDMLTASEGERLEMLKENFDATGKSFDQLDRFEKKALAQAAGFEDVGKAASFFNSSLEDMNETEEEAANKDTALSAQEELNKAIQRGVSIQDAFTARMEGIMVKIGKTVFPIIMDFVNFLTKAPKGGESPLDFALRKFEEFADWLEPNLFAPLRNFFRTDAGKDVLKFTGMLVGAGLAMKKIGILIGAIFSPIAMVFKTVIGPVKTMLSLFQTIGSFLSGTVVGAFLLMAASLAFLWYTINKHWFGFKSQIVDPIVNFFMVTMKDAINDVMNDIADFIDTVINGMGIMVNWFKTTFPGIYNMIVTPFNLAVDAIKYVFNGIVTFIDNVIVKNIVDAFKPIQNVIAEILNVGFIETLNSIMVDVFDMAKEMPQALLPDFLKGTPPVIPMIPKLHEGGQMVGPSILKNDEYIMIPPKTGTPPTVMTPEQMGQSMAQQPVTVVINIDGREFVKQTVIPSLNKEFKLQGIG